MHRAVTVFIRVFSDIFAFVALFVAMAVLQRVQPVFQGFFEDDYTIRLPRHNSTVSSITLYAVSSVLIVLSIIAVELMMAWDNLREKKAGIPIVLYNIYDYLLVAFYGYFVTITITDVGKFAAGRLRPSFFAQCDPQINTKSPLGYVTSFICTKQDKNPWDARKSFPSGHSSLAIYSAVFLCIYLQVRQAKFRIPALRVAAQTVFVALAFVTCITRITDYRHHPTDVIAGAALGLFVALSVPFYMGHLFRKTPENLPRPICPEMELDAKRSPLVSGFTQSPNMSFAMQP